MSHTWGTILKSILTLTGVKPLPLMLLWVSLTNVKVPHSCFTFSQVRVQVHLLISRAVYGHNMILKYIHIQPPPPPPPLGIKHHLTYLLHPTPSKSPLLGLDKKETKLSTHSVCSVLDTFQCPVCVLRDQLTLHSLNKRSHIKCSNQMTKILKDGHIRLTVSSVVFGFISHFIINRPLLLQFQTASCQSQDNQHVQRVILYRYAFTDTIYNQRRKKKSFF